VKKGKPDSVVLPATPPLTSRGLDWCDGCGTRLDPGDRLCGLCPACQDVKATGAMPKVGPKSER